MIRKIIAIVIISLSACFFQLCGKSEKGDRVLFDFENEQDLDRLNWKCHTLFSISDEFAAQGLKSLKVELYPSDYPGVSFRKYKKNWDGYQAISFDVFNPENDDIGLVVRIDDTPDNKSYFDRVNHRILMKPGKNRIFITLLDLKTSGANRIPDLKHIYKFILFAVRPESRIILFIDNIRLVKK